MSPNPSSGPANTTIPNSDWSTTIIATITRWKGYDEALLITHSSYINDHLSYIDSGISVNGNNIFVAIESLSNVRVFGCHLSGKVGGSLSIADITNRIVQYLRNLKVDTCCKSVKRIQIVSTRMQNKGCIPIEMK